MTTDDFQVRGEATAAFERRLTDVVLEGFAAGASIDGTWEIDAQPECVPNWTVEITQHDRGELDHGHSILTEGTDETASEG